VLLLAVDNQLGDVGYTIAVEQIFYVFFALCLLVMLAGFGHERLRHAGRTRLCAVVDRIAQVLYAGTARLVLVALCPLIHADGRNRAVTRSRALDGQPHASH
jgi:branched-chain amino acid transport system substrate-binding protein